MKSSCPKIVIVGGGAGGLELATQLGHKLGKKNNAQIVLVDKNRTHIWKPLLHEVATGSLDSDLDGVVYSAHAAKHGYQFQLGTFCDLDADKQFIKVAPITDDTGKVLLPERQIQYDKLVIAVGSVSNDFNTPGVRDHCFFLDSHQQANRFHHALLDSFTRVHQSESINELNIAIVGGGATGVELSAELYHVTDLLKIYGLSKMTKDKLNIHLIEAGPRILPALPERIATSARRELSKLGVNVMENTRISEATPSGFVTADGELIEANLMLWAAGVKAPDFIKDIELFELNRANQIMVKANLLSTTNDEIYVIGDCCACQQADGSFVPPRAQSAHQMAQCVEKNILHELKGEALESYTYVDHGSLVNLSRFSTVGSLMGNLTKNSMFIEGRIARLVYISLYRMHQKAIHGTFKTIALWLAEKLMRVVRPRMKLH
ncbi:NAD(P)/FAD-dependent oxidoreductase [Shewanella eurypsychrophilus]|uniref:NAD(P)/FAD-dependent oxidoreductase n=1 Tax=Shewanella eurypsychrophilus TaxID=2593656 RepID=A0ABX6V7K1_9GAMM|nr:MULTISPECIES: NAD(P)/FAD-dependent oxidoreductase [Shewanella]QFU22541.1 NAD(P)/FAD-dependent oxidoreductase [Shewanella sp. YLB-09]QPG57830.1 NAD(P)/FAD-dependent oxidoreductase [Shewanella eurypsychrophilus]